ncbi:MAG: sporulation protein [Oscillospiraceae bacterium]|nr:sporulation protein [Oscillospiraceae bacterium]
MKKLKAVATELAEKFELPAEAVGAAKLTLTGGSRLLVENHTGLLEYGEERMIVSCMKGKIIIYGSELRLVGMNADELAIAGSIKSVEWEK